MRLSLVIYNALQLTGWLTAITGCGHLTKAGDTLRTDRLAGRVTAVLASAKVVATPAPSHDRIWKPNISVLPYAEIQADKIYLHNIRDTKYRTEDDCDVRHFDKMIWLDDLQTIDFIVVPFKNSPALAHTMVSFGLKNGDQIAFSVEARLEQGEHYDPIGGSVKKYELICVVGTERDLIGLRTAIRGDDVYLYRTIATPVQSREVFLAAAARINEIARQPEFYDTFTNNCTTNLVELVNKLRPGAIPEDIRVVLPGHSDKMLYDQGLIQAYAPFELMREAARVNLASNLHLGSDNFSTAIRAGVAL